MLLVLRIYANDIIKELAEEPEAQDDYPTSNPGAEHPLVISQDWEELWKEAYKADEIPGRILLALKNKEKRSALLSLGLYREEKGKLLY